MDRMRFEEEQDMIMLGKWLVRAGVGVVLVIVSAVAYLLIK